MRRIVWWLASFAVWLVMGHLLTSALLNISWDIPLWLQHGTEWAIRKMESPDYLPDAADIDSMLALLLFVVAHLISAAGVVPASVIAWQRAQRNPK
ncbi:hypothetical protein [Paraburkholderia antibiotica]|uniref:Uncharacterized protein n=1 Tax=Paraburkholderia antibiotica TaxID=2728839 RepID=A0A7X9ZWP1_9BURK|nr:hypothetical protein [Paraburkholderia antibiotica]NML29770.1 hypothetical protein [Paraburkholderia antibiotica]